MSSYPVIFSFIVKLARVLRKSVGVLGLIFVCHALARQYCLPQPLAQLTPLPPAPPLELLQILSLGDAAWLAQLLNLYVQAHDVQAGSGLLLKQTDHTHVLQWLRRLRQLDPHNSSPLFLAAHVYLEVAPPAAQRAYLHWISQEFQRQPAHTWRYMAHAVWFAQHQLSDTQFALQLAQQLRQSATLAPPWARQMELLILQRSGATQQALTLLHLLLRDQPPSTAAEQQFLLDKFFTLTHSSQFTQPTPPITQPGSAHD